MILKIETEVKITTQVFAKKLLEYANYSPSTPKDITTAIKKCRADNPPPDGKGVDADAFWKKVILVNPGCKKFIEKQRIDSIEELLRRYDAYLSRLGQQERENVSVNDGMFY